MICDAATMRAQRSDFLCPFQSPFLKIGQDRTTGETSWCHSTGAVRIYIHTYIHTIIISNTYVHICFVLAGLITHPDFVNLTRQYQARKGLQHNVHLWPLSLLSATPLQGIVLEIYALLFFPFVCMYVCVYICYL